MASSEVFIIFVSSGFSEYCYNREIERGGEKRRRGEEEKRRRGEEERRGRGREGGEREREGDRDKEK